MEQYYKTFQKVVSQIYVNCRNLKWIITNYLSLNHRHFKAYAKYFFWIYHTITCYISQKIYNMSRIYIINLKYSPLLKLCMTMFNNWPVTVMFTNDFHICCITSPELLCTINPWHTSCSNLLPSLAFKACIIIISTNILLLNFLSLFKNVTVIVKRQQSSLFSLIVCFLNVGDILCGFYLSILFAGDLYFGEDFVVNDQTWRNGTVCSIAFVTILIFSMVVPYLLSLLSLARLMVVIYPFKSRFKSTSFVYKCTVGGFVCTGCLAFLFCAKLQIKQPIPTILCSPFIDPTYSITEIKFLIFFVISIQIMSFAFITFVYCYLFKFFINGSKKSLVVSRDMNKRVIFQLFILTSCNVLGWFPASIVFIVSHFSKYPSILLLWTAIAVTPMNSIINPIIFIFSFKNKKSQANKQSVIKNSLQLYSYSYSYTVVEVKQVRTLYWLVVVH